MSKSSKFDKEVQEHRGEYPSILAVVDSIEPKIGCVPQTLLGWSCKRK